MCLCYTCGPYLMQSVQCVHYTAYTCQITSNLSLVMLYLSYHLISKHMPSPRIDSLDVRLIIYLPRLQCIYCIHIQFLVFRLLVYNLHPLFEGCVGWGGPHSTTWFNMIFWRCQGGIYLNNMHGRGCKSTWRNESRQQGKSSIYRNH